jgi:hypothetical protein
MISSCDCLDQPVLGNRPLRRKLQSYPPEGIYSSAHFSSLESTRNTKDRLIPTLAYQMALSSEFRYSPYPTSPFSIHINSDNSIVKVSYHRRYECNDSLAQIAILNAISRSFLKHRLPLICGGGLLLNASLPVRQKQPF